jgi:hypothetical protein
MQHPTYRRPLAAFRSGGEPTAPSVGRTRTLAERVSRATVRGWGNGYVPRPY